MPVSCRPPSEGATRGTIPCPSLKLHPITINRIRAGQPSPSRCLERDRMAASMARPAAAPARRPIPTIGIHPIVPWQPLSSFPSPMTHLRNAPTAARPSAGRTGFETRIRALSAQQPVTTRRTAPPSPIAACPDAARIVNVRRFPLPLRRAGKPARFGSSPCRLRSSSNCHR